MGDQVGIVPLFHSVRESGEDNGKIMEVGMYTDKDEMQSAKEKCQALIKSGEDFALTTTALPIAMVDEVSKWNEKVIDFLRKVYGGIISNRPISEFEHELKGLRTAGDKFAVLITRLKSLISKIEEEDDTLFRRPNLTEVIQKARMQ